MRFNPFRFLGAKLVQYHLSITIQMVSTEGFNSDKPGTDIRFTGFFKSQTIYRTFTATRRATLFRFTGFLQNQARPPFSIYRVFTLSSQAPFFDLQGFYSANPGPLFRFTGFLQREASTAFQRL